jgi:hypothetical protein
VVGRVHEVPRAGQREVVEDADLVARVVEVVDERAADVAGTARDEDPNRGSPPPANCDEQS